MKFCMSHWDQLREAIKARGLFGLVATSGEQAVAQAVGSLEGKPERETFDPLMGAHNMIFSKALDMVGLALMAPNDDGTERCPICFLQKCHDDQGKCVEEACVWNEPERVRAFWIDGPADAMRRRAVELGLLPGA